MLPPHVVVFYDAMTLAPRIVVVNEDGEDGAPLLNGTDAPKGMARVAVAKSEVQRKSFYEIADYAIFKKHGRHPPTMEEVHAADAMGG